MGVANCLTVFVTGEKASRYDLGAVSVFNEVSFILRQQPGILLVLVICNTILCEVDYENTSAFYHSYRFDDVSLW